MSCRDLTVNRSRIEAIREVNVAKTLMLSEDYIGARDKLVKAKQLCPELDDIAPMVKVCDILKSANILKLSMTDHYWVLEVTPSSTSSDVHSRYKTLVPILQAIKSKFPGTDLALELVHSAYHVLSDREKRSEFDKRRKKYWDSSTSGDSKVAAYLDIDQEHDDLSDQDVAIQELYDWKAGDFEAGQVWAVYCGEESRPQQYTRIDRVVSETRVRVTYLEPGPPVTCGVFRLGEIGAVLEPSRFSHLVEAKSEELCYTIYPRKGEVWAMYETQRCLVAEILSEFSDGVGIKIARLVEVEGCLTFFTRQKRNGFELLRVVPESEMPSFSHRIPSYHCAGTESYGIPEGSWHLEPSALPVNSISGRL